MTDLFWARWQMAFSLGFHIVFACVGMAMPVFMATAEAIYLKTGDKMYLRLARAWAKGVAIFFATGAVSGTVLSFELGLLFPAFMDRFGPVIGLPFAWEGTAFFLEAIFLGLWLYGWRHLSAGMHLLCGIGVAASGLLSGVMVLSVNGFMNAPRGFTLDADGEVALFDAIDAMFNAAWAVEALHMVWAAMIATGFAVAGVHAARGLVVGSPSAQAFHRRGVGIALGYGAFFALTMPISGDFIAKHVAEAQPLKLAAMESHFHSERRAPIVIGGVPNLETQEVEFALKIPWVLSFLAFGDVDAEVRGLDTFDRDLWPPVLVCHIAFQLMVGIGFWLTLLGLVQLLLAWRRRKRKPPWPRMQRHFAQLVALSTPLGFIAVEAGWTVTEVGRQPWIVYGVMKTADAVTVMPGLVWSFTFTVAVYAILGAACGLLLKRHILHAEGREAITDALRADADGADAQEADAQEADAQEADADGADAQEADAQEADAQEADAQQADAQGADAS